VPTVFPSRRLIPFLYEADFIQGLQKSKLGDFADRIYPFESEIKRTTDTA